MRIFFDVDTQKDFMDRDGAMYVQGAEEIKPNLLLLTQFAVQEGIFIMGSREWHTPIDMELFDNPKHCLAGSPGSDRIPETTVPRPICVLGTERIEPIPAIDMGFSKALYFDKRVVDVFTNDNLITMLGCVAPNEVVLYGVSTESSILRTAVGFRHRCMEVFLVTDAIAGRTPEDHNKSVLDLREYYGVNTVLTKDIINETKLERTKSVWGLK